MMRSAALFILLVPALLSGCVRQQAFESDIAKTNLTGVWGSASGAGNGSQQPALTSQPNVTPQDVTDALKQKGVDVEASPVPGLDRNGAVASVLTLRPASGEPVRVLAYLCASEDVARELVGLMGDGAFASGRFAIGPYSRTPDDRALAQKLRKALD
jgi:hypothetical protein